MKRPSTEVTVNLLALAAIAALGVWLLFATEWVDVWRPTPPRNEAARDSHYAIKQIAARLGAKVTSPDNLDRLPPPGATLVLESNDWDFLPGRSQQLRQWVEVHGGHLVLPSFFTTGATIDWLPLRQKKRSKGVDLSCPAPGSDNEHDAEDDDDGEDDERKDAKPTPAPASRPLLPDPRFIGPQDGPRDPCPVLAERVDGNTEAEPRRGYRLCDGDWLTDLEATPAAAEVWALVGRRGTPVLRGTLGNGRVTAMGAWRFLDNRSVFKGDHAQAAIAMLDLRAGTDIWFVIEEKRDALLTWLWHRAGPAIGLALLAVALALWRGAQRFGPLLPQAPLVRRSVAEQIRGTAAFVLRGGGAALQAAARRALDDAARQRIAGYDRMTAGQRVEALRQPTGLPADVLTRALDLQLPSGYARGRALTDKLAVIEQARRRLAFNK
jgi:hypothetical protein